MGDLEYRSFRASLILKSIIQAAELADGDAANFEAVCNWLTLIQAASQHAHSLLVGSVDSEDEVPHV